jgi:hypothetical protein
MLIDLTDGVTQKQGLPICKPWNIPEDLSGRTATMVNGYRPVAILTECDSSCRDCFFRHMKENFSAILQSLSIFSIPIPIPICRCPGIGIGIGL